MRRNISLTISTIFLGAFFFSACAPGNFLSGAAGDEEESVPFAKDYKKPVLLYTPDGGSYLSGISMGKGNYQIEYPTVIDLYKNETIRLIIVPPSITINKGGSSNLEILQDVIEVYPLMHAELIANDSFNITTNQQAAQPILSNSASIWSWIIEPQEIGEKIVSLTISVPVITDGQDTLFGLVHIDLKINVKALPTPTPTTAPTSTPIPSVENQLTASAGQITITALTILGSIVTTLLAIYLPIKFTRNKSTKKKKIQQEKELEERQNKLKENLPNNKKRK